MINAKHLRIGNWVSVGTRKEIVDAISVSINEHTRCIHLTGNGIWNRENQIDPIPLTSEILLACGFVNEDMYEGEIWMLYSTPKYNFEIAFYENIEESQKEYVDKLKPIRCYISREDSAIANIEVFPSSLHQLQNLIHALTSTELIFKT